MSLGRRLYLIGVAQLLITAATAVIVAAVVGPPPHFHHPPADAELMDHRSHPPLMIPPLLTLVGGLVVVGLGAVVATRSIVRPLEKLSVTANAIGAGDLGARTQLDRTDELGQLGHAFDDMAARIERLVHAEKNLVRAEKELMANVSHELRTPLARIRVALDLATQGNDEYVRTSLSAIALDIVELEAILDDIMTTARLEVIDRAGDNARLPLHLESLDVGELCTEVKTRFVQRHPSRTLDISADSPAPRIIADAVLFRRALDNLVENAQKYSSADSHVSVRSYLDGADVCFEVNDRGVGISLEDLPHIFEPFFRAERSRVRSAGGVGLGLTLVKRIVEAHGGTIAVQSEVDRGTRVVVRVPSEDAA